MFTKKGMINLQTSFSILIRILLMKKKYRLYIFQRSLTFLRSISANILKEMLMNH